jgi:hypothetical protein
MYYEADLRGLRCRQRWEDECRASSRIVLPGAKAAAKPAAVPGASAAAEPAIVRGASDAVAPNRPRPPPASPVPSGDATSPATGSADSAEHAPTGRVVVDLLGIKEEPIDECMHTAADSKGEAWPCTKDLEVMIWEGNTYSEDSVGNLIQTLDSTLFQYNMRASWVLLTFLFRGHHDPRKRKVHIIPIKQGDLSFAGSRGFL